MDVALASDSSARQRILELSEGGCEVAVDCSGELPPPGICRGSAGDPGGPSVIRGHRPRSRSFYGSGPLTPQSRFFS